MGILGVRCSSTDFTYAVLNGTADAPQVDCQNQVLYPKGYPKPQLLNWVLQEISAIISRHQVRAVILKAFEGRHKDKSYCHRIEVEAVIMLACYQNGNIYAGRKVNATIAKDLGLKGRARYLSTGLNLGLIPSLTVHGDKGRDAILAAWSGLQ